jgi:hypothetical protein
MISAVFGAEIGQEYLDGDAREFSHKFSFNWALEEVNKPPRRPKAMKPTRL